MVDANLRDSYRYLSATTIGIILLGTPHRGTTAAWSKLINSTATSFGSYQTTSKEIIDDAEAGTELLYEFSSWAFRQSILVACFFEELESDFKGSFGLFKYKSLVHILIHRSYS
jgi:hypothetical protein